MREREAERRGIDPDVHAPRCAQRFHGAAECTCHVARQPQEGEPTPDGCECEVIIEPFIGQDSEIYIHYCKMHKAAPALVEALEAQVAAWDEPTSASVKMRGEAIEKARRVLAMVRK